MGGPPSRPKTQTPHCENKTHKCSYLQYPSGGYGSKNQVIFQTLPFLLVGALSNKKSCRWTNKDNPTTVQRPSPQECLCTFAHFALCLFLASQNTNLKVVLMRWASSANALQNMYCAFCSTQCESNSLGTKFEGSL